MIEKPISLAIKFNDVQKKLQNFHNISSFENFQDFDKNLIEHTKVSDRKFSSCSNHKI